MPWHCNWHLFPHRLHTHYYKVSSKHVSVVCCSPTCVLYSPGLCERCIWRNWFSFSNCHVFDKGHGWRVDVGTFKVIVRTDSSLQVPVATQKEEPSVLSLSSQNYSIFSFTESESAGLDFSLSKVKMYDMQDGLAGKQCVTPKLCCIEPRLLGTNPNETWDASENIFQPFSSRRRSQLKTY